MAKQRKQAVRHDEYRGDIPAIAWVFLGVLMGIGLTVWLALSGVLPRAWMDESASSTAIERTEPSPASIESTEPERQQFDFYKLLPEMEVAVPDEQLARERERTDSDNAQDAARYLLQVGSFRESGDADTLKAQLALLGLIANVQVVDVNGSTWHRVRLGPYTSAREADTARRRLRENQLDAIVLQDS